MGKDSIGVKNMIKRVVKWIKVPLLFWRKLIAVEQKVEGIDFLLRASLDITKMSPARGHLRLLQLANAVFLRKVTTILERHEIPYWINFGTLLGAVRHGGFIPWDDDLDISILRDDRERMLEILAREFRADGLVKVIPSDCVRIRLLGTPCQIDVFASDPVSFTSDDAGGLDRLKQEFGRLQSALKVDFGRLKRDEGPILNRTDAEIQRLGHDFAKRWSTKGQKYILDGFEGLGKLKIWHWDWIFPIRKISFEGVEFCAPHDPEAMLSAIYGDYMTFPKGAPPHSDILSKLDDKALVKMSQLVAGDSNFC